MDNLISRQAVLDIIDSKLNGWLTDDEWLHLEGVAIGIECLPRIDAVPVVRCKDCKYRPTDTGGHGYGQDLEFANDYKCPCKCEDGWYSWMPEDDWFCANGERSEECLKNIDLC